MSDVKTYLGQKGYTIFLGCRDIEKGKEATSKLMTLGITEVTPILLDVSDSGSIAVAVEAISNTVNCLDVLVNNAGTFEEEWGTMPSALTVKEMRDTFDANFFGPFEIIREFNKKPKDIDLLLIRISQIIVIVS